MPVKRVVRGLPLAQSVQRVIDDPVQLGVAGLAVAGHPGVEVGAPHEHLPERPVVGQRMVGVGEPVPEPSDAAAAVLGELAERQVRIGRAGERDPLDDGELRPLGADPRTQGPVLPRR